jgi:hypothetical protein
VVGLYNYFIFKKCVGVDCTNVDNNYDIKIIYKIMFVLIFFINLEIGFEMQFCFNFFKVVVLLFTSC